MHGINSLITVSAVPVVAITALAAPAEGIPAPHWPGTPTDPVIVANAENGKRAFFGDMIKLHDGRLLVAYRESVAHINQDGRIMVVQSTDDGHTWSTPRL